jgi:hypothetical protein
MKLGGGNGRCLESRRGIASVLLFMILIYEEVCSKIKAISQPTTPAYKPAKVGLMLWGRGDE